MAKQGLGLIFGTIKRLLFEVDSVSKAFERATGMGDRFGDSMYEQYRRLDEFGLTMEDVSASFQSFIKNSSEFTLLNDSMADSLTETANLLSRMGVSLDDLSVGLQNSIKFFGMGARQYEVYMRELEQTARALRMTPQELTEDFAKAGKSLAKFGSQGAQTFKELARVSKITGMEIEKIIDLTAKFDTFESAAEMAGKLNAALGGNFINAMDMMMDTDPVSRFEKIRDAIMSTGLTFDEMSYYQKQFYTQSLGLSDVGELALMMSGNMDMMSGATTKSAREYAELAEQAKINMDLQERFNALIADAAPHLHEIIDYLHGLFDQLEENKKPITEFIANMFSFVTMIENVIPHLEKMPQLIKGIAYALGGIRLAIVAINMSMLGTPAGALIAGITGFAAVVGLTAGIGNISQAYNVERNSPTQAETMQMIKEDSENAGIALDGMRVSMIQNVEASRRAGRANNDMTTQLSRQASALREVAELSQAGPGTDLLSSLGDPDVEGMRTTLQLVEGIAAAVNSIETDKTLAFNTTLDAVVASATPLLTLAASTAAAGAGNQQLTGNGNKVLGTIKIQTGPEFQDTVAAISLQSSGEFAVGQSQTGGSGFLPGVYKSASG
jgi:soluble cytochrome b562